VARYRSGIGSSGLVAAGSLTLLQTRPLGVRGVTNPVAADGAADPERLDSARQNAPNTVVTLDRVVSLQDFEAFARGFAGIGKAQAVPFWIGEAHLVHVSVAGLNGTVIKTTSSTYRDLVAAIAGAGDPVQAFRIDPHQSLLFNVTARIVVDSHYDQSAVLDAVNAAIVDAYSFTHRDFGQTVTAAEVVTTIQSTAGVVATDLVQLYRMDDATGPMQTAPNEFLSADRAHFAGDAIVPAQLLLVNRAGITTTATGSLA
jgi:predicted phage baseplate assembly protein